MTSYAALLRGIMPSKPNMRNERLRAVFDGLGFDAVASVLASGNIVFRTDRADPAELEDRIHDALARELDITGGGIVREYQLLRDLLDRDPFEGRTHSRETYLTATFLKFATPADTELPDDPDPMTRVIGYDPHARVFLAVIDNSTPKAPDFMAWLQRTHGKGITTRTWLSVQRVVQKMESGQ